MESGTDVAMHHGAGAVMGALVGDAAGAVLEFLGRAPTEAEVHRALDMPGGGVWRVAPGQITDDGELTVSLLGALAPGAPYDADRVAAAYVAWYRSSPFDVGGTTAAALRAFAPRAPGDFAGAAAALERAAREASMGSKANGSLMRASPLGVWGHALPTDILVAAARQDSALTHPNLSCADAVAAYSIAIATLIRERGDRAAAFAAAETWADAHANDEVRGWIAAARAGENVPYHPLAGFIRIAFVHAFRHLLAGTSFVDALRETLLGGGDTDTNACIVGGLIGAADGLAGIPESMRRAVLECATRSGRPRPSFLHPREVLTRVQALVAAPCPSGPSLDGR
jgi:ADP-ribosyl-[dinitrogen reductase] hydrolase